MSFFIKDIEIKSKVVLGPMAGNTNYAYRKIARENGCGLVYAEMVSDKALNFNNTKTLEMIKVGEDEHPCSMQIFGSDVHDLVKAAMFIDKHSNCDIIDINMGCPVNKVAKKANAGSALLREPEKVFEIVSSVVKSVTKPVTVKIRTGWDSDSINAVEIAMLIEKAGASAIAIHGRTRAQLYSGNADWNIIKKVKEAVSIPVIGNGDVRNCFDAKKMIDETGVDAVMVARASQGNPFIFNQINEYLENDNIIEKPSYEAIYLTIKKHFSYLREFKDDHVTMLEMRGQIGYYMKGLPHATKVKPMIFKTKNIDDMMNLVDEYFEQIINENK
ncbi:MAG: tRNA dihydrouridine synthase DusB [bacterium]